MGILHTLGLYYNVIYSQSIGRNGKAKTSMASCKVNLNLAHGNVLYVSAIGVGLLANKLISHSTQYLDVTFSPSLVHWPVKFLVLGTP